MDIGQKIKHIRVEKGLTFEELGAMVGVGKSTVRKWENGMIENMRRDKIESLSKALGVSPAYLIGCDDNLTYESGNMIADLMMDSELLIYVEKIMNMPQEQKQRIYGYIDSIQEK